MQKEAIRDNAKGGTKGFNPSDLTLLFLFHIIFLSVSCFMTQ